MPALEKRQTTPSKVTGAVDRPWHMRAWSGISVSGWWRALSQHRFQVSPSRLPMATLISGMSVLNSTLGVVQRWSYGQRIEQTQLVDEPVFVVGHWRSGTTLLHELLVQDARFTYPSTYACFCPNHFLVSEWWLKRMIGLFLPRKRPMDNMAIGWDLPQEDEWALCNMGLPSPYRKIMFPNLPLRDRKYQSLRDLSPPAREHWQARFKWLLQALTVREPKRIILKTPVHTARVAALREIFPAARFIHIARNPFVVFPSTIHTWQRLYRYQGLQVPKFEHLEEDVLQTLAEMYEAFEQDKQLIAPENFQQVSYEELTADPAGVLRGIYEHFGWTINEQVQASWDDYAARSAGYQTNRYDLTATQQAQIVARWAEYFSNYGYSTEVPA